MAPMTMAQRETGLGAGGCRTEDPVNLEGAEAGGLGGAAAFASSTLRPAKGDWGLTRQMLVAGC